MSEELRSGAVFHYPYLWTWQRDRGETEGRKLRPVCMLLSVRRDDQTYLVLLAISSTPPRRDQLAIVVPQLECRRAGLDEWKEAWITLSEFNYDIVERSYYLDPNAEVLGYFSKGFLVQVATAFKRLLPSQKQQVARL